MRDVILQFITELRRAGLRISLSESMDAMQATAFVGVERNLLREALAASLVKEEEDRPTFETIFAQFFAGPGKKRKGKFDQFAGGEEKQQAKAQHAQVRPQEQPSKQSQIEDRHVQERPEQQKGQKQKQANAFQQKTERQGEEVENKKLVSSLQSPASKAKALLEKPFKEFDARDIETSKDLVEELARRLRTRLSRRYKRGRYGRLDFRRTFRAAVASGGTPIELFWRYRRPGKPDLVAFCDLSGSVAIVSDFLLALIAPASEYFRRVHTFAYVDRLCEVSFENGYVVPHETLDLYARSDFGKVLQQFWRDEREQLLTRNTIVLLLGDARNNRRPPRTDLLARMRDRAKKVIWLNPEPRERWNTGDSVMSQYTPACDIVLGCGNLHELLRALKQAL